MEMIIWRIEQLLEEAQRILHLGIQKINAMLLCCVLFATISIIIDKYLTHLAKVLARAIEQEYQSDANVILKTYYVSNLDKP